LHPQQTLEGRYQQLLLDRRQRMVCFKHLKLGKETATWFGMLQLGAISVYTGKSKSIILRRPELYRAQLLV